MRAERKPTAEKAMTEIRVLLVDDHAIFRGALREVIDGQSDMTVVGEAEDGIEAMDRAEELAPDIVLMDINLPRLDGIRAAQLITERNPGVRIIVLSMRVEHPYVLAAIRAGARGYVPKDADLEQMLEAIRTVHCGEVSIDSAIATEALMKVCQEAEDAQERIISLTEREKEILSFVIKGATNREIAQELLLSEQTIKNRLSAIFRKLGVRNRTEAALYAIQEGLLTSPRAPENPGES